MKIIFMMIFKAFRTISIRFYFRNNRGSGTAAIPKTWLRLLIAFQGCFILFYSVREALEEIVATLYQFVYKLLYCRIAIPTNTGLKKKRQIKIKGSLSKRWVLNVGCFYEIVSLISFANYASLAATFNFNRLLDNYRVCRINGHFALLKKWILKEE